MLISKYLPVDNFFAVLMSVFFLPLMVYAQYPDSIIGKFTQNEMDVVAQISNTQSQIFKDNGDYMRIGLTEDKENNIKYYVDEYENSLGKGYQIYIITPEYSRSYGSGNLSNLLSYDERKIFVSSTSTPTSL